MIRLLYIVTSYRLFNELWCSPSWAAVGATRLLPVTRVHPAVQLVAVKPDCHSWTRCPEPICLHGAVDGGPLAATVAGRLLVSQIRTFRRRCLHVLSSPAIS